MNFDDAKAEVMSLSPEETLSISVNALADRIHADAGFVVWDATTPANANFVLHKNTFLDAVYTAMAFVQGATGKMCEREWLVVGKAAHVVLRTLPKFEEKPLLKCAGKLWFTGMLGRITVYVSNDIPWNEWLAGDVQLEMKPQTKCCCRGMVQNYPTSFGEPPLPPPQPAFPRIVVDGYQEPNNPVNDDGDPIGIPYEPERVEPEVVEEEPEFQRLNEGRILL